MKRPDENCAAKFQFTYLMHHVFKFDIRTYVNSGYWRAQNIATGSIYTSVSVFICNFVIAHANKFCTVPSMADRDMTIVKT